MNKLYDARERVAYRRNEKWQRLTPNFGYNIDLVIVIVKCAVEPEVEICTCNKKSVIYSAL
jgi:hypothetical protein